MSSSDEARTAILSAIRAAKQPGRAGPEEITRAAADLLAEPARWQPKFDDLTNRARFIERATSERLTATVDEVGDLDAAPGAIATYLQRANLPLRIAHPPMTQLADLDWGEIATAEEIEPNEPVAVNMADCAIAETGTLVFTSRPESPTLFNFFPLHHVILLDAGAILRHHEDFWMWLRDQGNVQPRNINMITGTSGTADIEAKNIRGAHGPRFMHIVIFGED